MGDSSMISEGYYLLNLFISDRTLEQLETENGAPITDEETMESTLQSMLDNIGLSELAKRYFNRNYRVSE